MIEFVQGDLLEADVEALVNTVNCVGIMGRGVALQFRHAFPENFKAYEAACAKDEVRLGQMFIVDLGRLHNPRFVINFPTKKHWKSKSRLSDIETGLKSLIADVRRLGIKSIALPPLGCGLGGLVWDDVRPMIEAAFQELPDVRVLVFEPTDDRPRETTTRAAKAPKMTPGRAALLGLVRQYLSAVMDPSVSLLEVHKLMYFMQESGEPLRLRFQKAHFGPYAENLRHVLREIEGHFITGYHDAGDDPTQQIEINPVASREAEAFLQSHPQTAEHFRRVGELIGGFETAYGMELLATVHWVATRDGAATPEEAIAKVYSWNDRKRMFPEPHVRLAWDVLANKQWLKARQSA